MNNRKICLSKQILSFVLVALMLVNLIPITSFAAASELTTDIGQKTFKVGVPTEFTFTTTANEDLGTMVVGTYEFSDPSAIEKLEYLEVRDGNWYELSGDFGPETGFPMSNATSTFRVTFKKSGDYSFAVSMKKVADGTVVCSASENFTVKGKDKSVLTTDVADKTFVKGESTEFTFTTTANDYAGVPVIGSFAFSDPDAIEKLEYKEIRDGNWYELSGDFGPETGFPMSDATSTFRVTFNKAGSYSFSVSMKYAGGENAGEVLCTSGDINVTVKEKFKVTTEQIGKGTVKLDNKSVGEDGLVAFNGDEVNLAVTPEDGWIISAVSVGGSGRTITDSGSYTETIEVDKDTKISVTFVKVYTITVEYESTKGDIEISPAAVGGAVTVETGTNVTIKATPKATYRVSKVEVTGEPTVEISGNDYKSDTPYTKSFTADKDFTVTITFAPLIYNIAVDSTTNGSVTVNKNTVEHGDSVLVTVKPDDGYTIDSAKVNNTSVYDSIIETEEDWIFEFPIDNIQEDKNIAVKFKEREVVSESKISWNSDDALRHNNLTNLYVFAKGDKVTFSTTERGIRITDSNKKQYGSRYSKSVDFSSPIIITKIEVRSTLSVSWQEVNIGSNPIQIVFDTVKPTVSIKANSEPNANGYYNSDVLLTASANDSGDYSGIDYLEYRIECDGKSSESKKIYSYTDGESIESTVSIDDLKVIAAENNSNNVTVYVKAADRAGNVSEEEKIDLAICTTAPSVSIEFSDEQAAEADPGDSWYNSDRSAVITINDRADVFDETAANNGISFGTDSTDRYSLSEWTSKDGVHTAKITFNSEGSYDWGYEYKNKAGLEAIVSMNGKNAEAFKIDKTAPTGTITAQSASWDGTGIDWSTLLEKLTFGLYSTKTVSVGLKNNIGSDLLSGYRSVSYYVSNDDSALTESALKELYESGEFTEDRIEISNDVQFAVYARIVDNAGNVAFIGTNGVIYDLTASDIELEVVDKPNDDSFYGENQVKKYTLENGKNVRGIKVDIKATDLKTGTYYSGINKVEYTVSMGSTQTQSETLFEFRNANPAKSDLVKDWNGSLIIDADKNNGKDITVKVTVTDNAGNKSDKSITIKEISLDTITSMVTLTGAPVKTENGFGWYNSGRTAFITIIDRASVFDKAAATAGIVFEITDKDGKEFTASSEDVSIGEWNDTGDVHTVTVMFNRDGNYSWHLDYTNKAGNTLAESNVSYGTSETPNSFAIDKTVPHGTVSVSGKSWTDKILSVLTFGLYSKDEFDLSVDASDNENISPVTVEYYLHNGAKALTWGELDSLYNNNSFSETAPALSGKQQFTVYARITDYAGNYIFVSSDGHVIDPDGAAIELSCIDLPNEKGIYGQNEVQKIGDIQSGIRVSVSAKEADTEDDVYSGIQSVSYEVKSRKSASEAYSITQSGTLYNFDYKRVDGDDSNTGTLTITDVNKETQTYNTDDIVPVKSMLCRQWSGMITVNAESNNYCDVVVAVTVKDNAGNETSKDIPLDIDLTSPEISVEFNNNSVQNGSYFNAQRTAAVTFTERDHHFDQAAAENILKDSIKAVKLDGTKVDEAYSISWTSDTATSEPDKNTHTATIAFEKDAHYTWSVAYTDKAGNKNGEVKTGSSVAPFDFTVDTTEPTGSVSVNGSTWTAFLETITFGLYSNSTAKVSAAGADEISPVTVEYYKSNNDLGISKVDLADLTFVSYDPFEIDANEQFSVYVKVTDFAGNITLINSDGFIVDVVKSEITVAATDAANANGIYGLADVKDYSDIGGAKKGIKVHIDVNETDKTANSGIASIKYDVVAELGGEEVTTQSGTLFDFDYTRDSGDNSNGGKLIVTDVSSSNEEKTGKTPVKSELRTSWSGDIIVDAEKNNSSKVYVRVTVTDNAGNVTDYTVDAKAQLALDIDLTAPTIAVSYDNNDVLNEKYFGKQRTATITITERTNHFNADKATKGITVTAANNVADTLEGKYTLSGWTEKENTTEPDKTEWTATVEYKGDAQYTFGIAYSDEAGNENTEVSYGTSSAPEDFVVDATAPVGSVSIDDSIWTKFLDTITFGLFNGSSVEVLASGEDETSPVKIEYYKSNADTALTKVDLDALEFVSFEPFTVSADEQFSVYVKVTDYAGNSVLLNSDGYIVDTLKSAIKVTAADKANSAGVYGPSELKEYEVNGKTVRGIKVHIEANETDATVNSGIHSINYEVISTTNGVSTTTQSGTLYEFTYIRDEGDNSNGGTLAITDANAEKTEKAGQTPVKSELCTSWNGDIIVDAALNNNSNVTIKATVTDNAGNVNSNSIDIDVDTTAPEISVSYDNNNVLNEKYFNAVRTATIVITERANHFDADKATAGITITAKDVNGNDVNDAYVIDGWKESVNDDKPDSSNHTATVFFKADANYTFDISYTDEAGISNNAVATGDTEAPFEFTVDTVNPYGTVTVNGNTWSKFFETLTFGLFNNKTASVSATADDKTSPVKIEYYKSNDDFGKKEIDISSLELIGVGDYTVGKNEQLFDVNATEQFNVYVKITDKAGHVVLLNSDGYIVDTAMSPVSVSAITQPNENGVYGINEVKADKGIKLHIEANDTEDGNATHYSGIKSVSYNVTSVLNGKPSTTKTETLFDFDYTRDSGDNSNGGTLAVTDANAEKIEKAGQTPVKSELCTSWNGDILIDAAENNSSNVVVTVTVTDNAGNTNSDSIELDVNITSPAIDISFDNNTALNETYFNAPRTATVVITERTNHFNSVAATEGIVIKAVDAEGNNVDSAYTISGWKNSEDNVNPDFETHTATVAFEKDANYEFAISYSGKSGNANSEVNTGDSVAPYSFTVDTKTPEADISINEHVWDKLLNVLTFGLYSNIKAEIAISATDKTSPITVEYYKTNDPIAKNSVELDKLYDNGKFETFEEFTVNTNEQFVVYVRITDNAGNYKYVSTDGYIVDFTGPEVELTPDKPNKNNIYNKDVTVKIKTSDSEPYSGIAKVEYWVVANGTETQRKTLFLFDYTREEGKNTNNGTLVITDWADGTEKVTELTGNVPTQAQLYAGWEGEFTVDSSLNDCSNTEVYVGVTDNAGNYKEEKVVLDIDITAPDISVSYDSTANERAVDGYYTSRTATIVITERQNHFDAIAAKNGITITAADVNGEVVATPYTFNGWTDTVDEAEPDKTTHTATVTFDADANYTFAIAYTDKADNKNKPVNVDEQPNPYKFTVDKTAPTGTVIAKSQEGREEVWSSIVDKLTFGFWSNKSISVSGTSEDLTSPIQFVEYYMPVAQRAADNVTVLRAEDLDGVTSWKSFEEFDITENMQFTVYLKITDNAGNYTYISTNGLIVDEELPSVESVAPEISVSPAKPVNGIYSGDVKVDIRVEDPMVGGTYSGLKEIRYAVFDRASATPDEPTQEDTLFTFDNANPKQEDLLQKWTGEITVSAEKNNSNNIQIVVYAVDNSLNAVDNSQKESKSYTVIKVDTTAPVINISYNNNNVDSGKYFKANRTATITVVERNFNPDDVKITIKNTDGTIPAVSGWSKTNGTYNRDNATHTATITYSADGDYTFAIEYTDLAGNKCSEINYASGTAAARAFTIDKTRPTVSVSYNNNTAQNTNYFKDSRTATIVINEHNFNTDRIKVTMTATDDGAGVRLPAVNGWSTNGNTHTATITYSNDALYTFDIAYTDLAGNEAADYKPDSFYIDNKDPVLDITPAALNGSANNGEVKPVVTSTDTNFDQVNITLSGANRGQIKQFNGSYSNIHNGRVFAFANFAEEKEIDDIYTLSATVTDKAGRSTTKSVTFSVNRFGSTYIVSKDTSEMNNSYVKQAKDVVVSEINANEMTNIKITLFKNNQTIVLTPDKDYRIARSGGNGKWYKNVYTVFAKNFAEDGVYSLSIHSEDAAGNIAENTLDTKNLDLKFGVDSKAPTINVNNLKDGTTYNLENLTAQVSINDNLNLTKVAVYLDGEKYKSWSGADLETIIEEGGVFAFDISGESTNAHSVKIVAVDAAENTYTEEVSDFYVTTNLWVRFYNNKLAFFGSIAGVVALIGFFIFLIVYKRRKDDDEEEAAKQYNAK